MVKMVSLRNLNFKKTMGVCIFLLIFGILWGFIMFPKVLKMGIAKVRIMEFGLVKEEKVNVVFR